MLIKPDISDDTIVACLQDSFGLQPWQVTFLPLGYENSAVYRVTSDDGPTYFLKLRKDNFNEITVAVSAFLHAQGIPQVLSPLTTTTQTLWAHEHGFDWILYPFFDGKTGFEIDLSQAQWTLFGQAVRAVHATRLPPGLVERVPREDYSPGRRNLVQMFLEQVEQDRYDDPIASRFAALLVTKYGEIQSIVERAEKLARLLQDRIIQPVLCHSDLHGRNVLAGAENELAIVDWDAPILAPKERDLMFIGGGVGGIWYNDQEEKWFYEGYGQTGIDLVALTYYRYERIVTDIAERCEQIFGLQGSIADRQKGLRLVEQFLPNNVVEIAHKSYQQLSEGKLG